MKLNNKYKILIFCIICFVLLIIPLSCTQKYSKNKPQEQVQNKPDIINVPSEEAPELPEKEPLEKNQVEDTVLSEYKTNINNKNPDRVNNLQIASSKINNYVVKPGEIFSFNNVVGQSTAEKGYKEAPVIKKGEYVMDTGGGICQVSSTLFNAVQQAGMEIIEQHHHSKDVHYVPEGRDASVVYNGWDLKFRNTLHIPIKIQAYVENGQMCAKILKEKVSLEVDF